MRIIQTCDRQLVHKARLAQFRGVISTFEFEGTIVTGVVQSITEQPLEEGMAWRIVIRCKTERVVMRQRYNPKHRF